VLFGRNRSWRAPEKWWIEPRGPRLGDLAECAPCASCSMPSLLWTVQEESTRPEGKSMDVSKGQKGTCKTLMICYCTNLEHPHKLSKEQQ